MSRVHEALRRAEQLRETAAEPGPVITADVESHVLVLPEEDVLDTHQPLLELRQPQHSSAGISPLPGLLPRTETREIKVDWRNFLARCKSIAFHPAPEAHLIDIDRPHEVPGEEFRSLRT